MSERPTDEMAVIAERHADDERRGPATFWQPPGYGDSGLVAHKHRGLLYAALIAARAERDAYVMARDELVELLADAKAERDRWRDQWERDVDVVARQRDAISSGVMQDDMRDLMDVLGISTHARSVSPHEVMVGEVIPAVRRLVARTGARP